MRKYLWIAAALAIGCLGLLGGDETTDHTPTGTWDFSGATVTVQATTGDSATGFFGAGTLEHERGGLEADVSAYGGLVSISGGATSAISTKAGLEGLLSDVADICEADGDTYSGVHDFSGATVTVQASTGDSATGFFGAGTLEHERGGLEADVSAYSGLVSITGGATAAVNTKAGVEELLSDVSDLAEADGDTFTGNHDFSGATSVILPVVTDTPATCTRGQIQIDPDGNTSSDNDCASDTSPTLCICHTDDNWYGIDMVP